MGLLKYNRVNRKLMYIIIFILLFIFTTNIAETNFGTSEIHQQEELSNAFTKVNITLSDTDTLYHRETHVHNVQTDLPMDRFFMLGKLTTHGDMLVSLDVEYSAANEDWNNSKTIFANSSEVKHYTSFNATRDLLGVNITLLEITTDSFEIHEENRTEGKAFVINQQIIFKQTTAFLLSIREPFQFGLNRLELGKISDFHYQFEYIHFGEEPAFVMESVRIKAPGSAIEHIPNISGYSGTIYLSDFPYDPMPVPNFDRPFVHAPQDIMVSIKLPIGQNEINYDFDSYFKNKVGSQGPNAQQTKNLLTFHFNHNSYLPHAIYINSVTPFLEQFSISDYLSMLAGVFAALFTVLRGVPYMLNRRSFNRYKGNLLKAVEKSEWKKLEELEKDAHDRFLARKLSTSQYEELNQLLAIIREEQPVKSEETIQSL
jgi:hypothetical protein